jgi:hypothetical protein
VVQFGPSLQSKRFSIPQRVDTQFDGHYCDYWDTIGYTWP